MCHYLGGGLHGRQKRVKAQSESSKSVVNSVLISREMPVFPGFLEIIRVVNVKSQNRSPVRLFARSALFYPFSIFLFAGVFALVTGECQVTLIDIGLIGLG
jgi:hypothetical protein